MRAQGWGNLNSGSPRLSIFVIGDRSRCQSTYLGSIIGRSRMIRGVSRKGQAKQASWRQKSVTSGHNFARAPRARAAQPISSGMGAAIVTAGAAVPRAGPRAGRDRSGGSCAASRGTGSLASITSRRAFFGGPGAAWEPPNPKGTHAKTMRNLGWTRVPRVRSVLPKIVGRFPETRGGTLY